MEEELKKKIEKLSFFVSNIENLDSEENGFLMGIADGVLEFSRDEILKVCDDLFSFVIYGLAKSNQTDDIVDFLEEYQSRKSITLRHGKKFQCNFKYRNGTTNTIRFLHFAYSYIKKFKDSLKESPFTVGNVFLGIK